MASPHQRIINTGRLLVGLARTGQVLTILGVLALTYMLFRIAQPWYPDFRDFLPRLFNEPALALVNGWGALCTAIYLWTLERIRLIGTTLQHHAPISAEVASAVRRSVPALLLCGFSTLLQFDLAWSGVPASATATLKFNWMAFYAVCLLCVCVLVVARILQVAVELKAENEGFV